MSLALFIGGPLDGQTLNVNTELDYIHADGSPERPHTWGQPVPHGLTFIKVTYSKRRFTGGRFVYALDSMTDEEVTAWRSN